MVKIIDEAGGPDVRELEPSDRVAALNGFGRVGRTIADVVGCSTAESFNRVPIVTLCVEAAHHIIIAVCYTVVSA
jgi:hypothetical protein